MSRRYQPRPGEYRIWAAEFTRTKPHRFIQDIDLAYLAGPSPAVAQAMADRLRAEYEKPWLRIHCAQVHDDALAS